MSSAQINQFSDAILAWANPKCAAPVTKGYPLMSLNEALPLAFAYFLFVVFGSIFMKNFVSTSISEAIKTGVKPFTTIYNLVQVVLCAYMTFAAAKEALDQGYSPICNAFDDKKTGMAFVVWVFYASKALDFFDTIWIILRSSWKQLTFLHVYHHISIFLIYWMNANVGFDGDIYLTVVLNSFIHLMMYSYYFFTAIGIKVPGALKAFVTQSQLIQFVTMMSQAAFLLFYNCAFPRNVTIFYFVYILSLFILFSNFYIQSYVRGPRKSGGGDRAKPASTDAKKKHSNKDK